MYKMIKYSSHSVSLCQRKAKNAPTPLIANEMTMWALQCDWIKCIKFDDSASRVSFVNSMTHPVAIKPINSIIQLTSSPESFSVLWNGNCFRWRESIRKIVRHPLCMPNGLFNRNNLYSMLFAATWPSIYVCLSFSNKKLNIRIARVRIFFREKNKWKWRCGGGLNSISHNVNCECFVRLCFENFCCITDSWRTIIDIQLS